MILHESIVILCQIIEFEYEEQENVGAQFLKRKNFWYLFLELVPSSTLWNFLDNFFEAVLFVHNLKKKTRKQTKMQKKATIKTVSKRN